MPKSDKKKWRIFAIVFEYPFSRAISPASWCFFLELLLRNCFWMTVLPNWARHATGWMSVSSLNLPKKVETKNIRSKTNSLVRILNFFVFFWLIVKKNFEKSQKPNIFVETSDANFDFFENPKIFSFFRIFWPNSDLFWMNHGSHVLHAQIKSISTWKFIKRNLKL